MSAGNGLDASGAPTTILLVEDQEAVRQLLQTVIKSAGYPVLSALSGEDAIRIAGNHPGTIRLLITDVNLPGISGVDLATSLSKSHADLTVLYLSGYGSDVCRSEQGFVSHFLQKPFPLDVFVKKIREVLSNQQVTTASGTPA